MCILRLSDTVVWNPWPEKGEAMADLGYLFLIGNYFVKSEIKSRPFIPGGEASKYFICVEAGQCVEPVQVSDFFDQ